MMDGPELEFVPDGKWVTAEMKCRICNHEYVAVLPPGCPMGDCECPNCGNMSSDIKERES